MQRSDVNCNRTWRRRGRARFRFEFRRSSHRLDPFSAYAEELTGANPYHLEYEYDDRGNRTVKTDVDNDLRTDYVYDLDDPSAYGSKNNRLEFYEVYDTSGQSNTLLSTTWYFYNTAGNVERVVTMDESVSRGEYPLLEGEDSSTIHGMPPTYTAVRFEYAKNGEAVTFILGESWDPDGGDAGTCPDNYAVDFARQFRYDGARARYLNRELDVTTGTGLMHSPPIYAVENDSWSDYDGDEIYGDFTLSGSTATNQRSFQPGNSSAVCKMLAGQGRQFAGLEVGS